MSDEAAPSSAMEPLALSCSADLVNDLATVTAEDVQNTSLPTPSLNILNGTLWPIGTRLKIAFVTTPPPDVRLQLRIKELV